MALLRMLICHKYSVKMCMPANDTWKFPSDTGGTAQKGLQVPIHKAKVHVTLRQHAAYHRWYLYRLDRPAGLGCRKGLSAFDTTTAQLLTTPAGMAGQAMMARKVLPNIHSVLLLLPHCCILHIVLCLAVGQGQNQRFR